MPQGVDAICVGIADRAAGGGQFGRAYRLAGKQAQLPQTLRIEPGSAETAYAWVRADRGGVPVARAARTVDFGSDVTLALDRCAPGSAGAPAVVGAAVGPAAARLAASRGPGGDVVVAVGAESAVIDARDGVPISTPAPSPPPGTIVAVIAVDLDGDCDDDVIVASDAASPVVWRRTGTTFEEAGALDFGVVVAIAAADVDRDGDLDLVTATATELVLWRNDGSGTFTRDPSAINGGGRARSVRALALGDLDGDGSPDLIVGQRGDPMLAFLGDRDGAGTFVFADGVIAPISLDVARLELADADGDFDPDLAIAVAGGGPMRLFVNRDGRLEDQSFVRLPQPAPRARAIAIAGWDAGCEPDAVIAGDGGAPTLRGEPGGALAADGAAPPASDVVMVDLDDDGDLDAVLATPEGVVWLAR
ncbi:MAG: VCBS repeat-containing protein [Deltaproteobacteria bacterium]|nr:VCBS repeat-containing protein [Deltaproteobacteria bacterium]